MIGRAAGWGAFCCASRWNLRDDGYDAEVSSPESSDAIYAVPADKISAVIVGAASIEHSSMMQARCRRHV